MPGTIRTDIGRIVEFLRHHPLSSKRLLSSFSRVIWWQTISRLKPVVTVNWLADSKLAVERGMTGATGNIYAGLHEFADMAFLLHFLRPNDLFVDVGSNIGSFTILASKVCGARSIAIEPDPKTFANLSRNIQINDIGEIVLAHRTAVGATQGEIQFSIGKDTTNKVVTNLDEPSQTVPLSTLDALVGDGNPILLKLDVEGFEEEVLIGGKKTLSNQNLLAIETEGDDATIVDTLHSYGFVRAWYDPSSRKLLDRPFGQQNNALFVRDWDTCQQRLQSAQAFTVLGQKF